MRTTTAHNLRRFIKSIDVRVIPLLFVIFVVSIGSLFLFFGAFNIIDPLNKNQQTNATIEQRLCMEKTGTKTVCYVTIEYVIPQINTTFVNTLTCECEKQCTVQCPVVDSIVPVYYTDNDPTTVSFIKPTKRSIMFIILGSIVVVVACILGLFIFFGVIKPLSRHHNGFSSD